MLISLIVALVMSQTASADSRSHRRGYSSHDYGNHYRGYNPYHYGSRRGYNTNIFYGNRYSRRHDHDAGYFVGGLVLGSLLSYPRYAPPVERVVYRSSPVVRAREVVVVNRTSASSSAVASGRRLLRDLEGNCFERIIDEEGNEIRAQLEAEACSF